MVRSSRLVAKGILSTILIVLVSGPLVGQEHLQNPDEETGGPAHEFHRNHFGGFLGVSAHSDIDEVAPTLGLEYTRQFSPHWGASAYVELVSSKLERDLVVAVGAAYYPTRALGLVLAVGAEAADKEVIHNGETETEQELALLVRVGVAYGFRLTPEATIAPTLLVDQVGDRTTVVLGMGMVVGF
jgi:hypothetical protein